VVCEIGGSRGCVRTVPVADAVVGGSEPTGGRDSTGRVNVTSPSLTLIGTGKDTGGTLRAGSEPTTNGQPFSLKHDEEFFDCVHALHGSWMQTS